MISTGPDWARKSRAIVMLLLSVCVGWNRVELCQNLVGPHQQEDLFDSTDTEVHGRLEGKMGRGQVRATGVAGLSNPGS
jgi:hypothetical protein